MLISTALLLDSIIRNSVCTPAKLPCRRVEVGYENRHQFFFWTKHKTRIIGVQKSSWNCRNLIGVWIAASGRRLVAFIGKSKEPVINEVS
jgi:hypothetical protein